MKINNEKVLKFLPHRDPFLFVDEIVNVTLPEGIEPESGEIPFKDLIGSKVVGKYTTKAEHPIFAGHFPGNPILPGVVQIEMMAQFSAFVLVPAIPNVFDMSMDVALLSVDEAKFRKPILPGMELEVHTECTRVRGPFMSHRCEIYHNGENMSQATVMATVKLK